MGMNGFRTNSNLHGNDPGTLTPPFLDLSNIDLNFTIPDIRKLKLERQARNSSVLNKINVSLARNLCDRNVGDKLSRQDEAAIKIQKVFRGYLGRKHYLDVLYERVLASEEALQQQQQLQVEDGEILIENYKIESESHDTTTINRNKSRLLNASAITIQRLWREKRSHKQTESDHICCPCNDNYPDVYEYYKTTEDICFCCEDHRLHGYSEENILCIDDNSLSSSDNRSIISSSIIDNSEFLVNRDGIFSPSMLVTSDHLNNRDNTLTLVNETVSSNIDEVGPKGISALNIDTYGDELISCDAKICNSTETVDLSNNIEEIPGKSCKSTSKLRKDSLENMSVEQLKELIKKLETDISSKNLQLLEELMCRDHLHTQHETLLMEADILLKGLKR